jgi:nucleoid-associated protein YgaU
MAESGGKLTLAKAKIYEVDKAGNPKGSLKVDCMFNPFEYSVSKSNSFTENSKNDADTPQAEFSKSGAQTLKLNLFFDSFETGADISKETRVLWQFMMTKTQTGSQQGKKKEPPQVAFEWGVFKFVSYITAMTQQFTLFKDNGTPVRAKVDITFTQYTDVDDYQGQNPTSGGGPVEQVRRVVAGDRLDTIAAEIYQDAGKWRLIAAHNRIVDPLALRPGQVLSIPKE